MDTLVMMAGSYQRSTVTEKTRSSEYIGWIHVTSGKIFLEGVFLTLHRGETLVSMMKTCQTYV